MDKIAKFNIGDVVCHKRQGYRAVVIDADPIFQASGRYNPRAATEDFAQRNPWYRLLVDESTLITYVEECLLEPDLSSKRIDNPNLDAYLVERFGHYESTSSCH